MALGFPVRATFLALILVADCARGIASPPGEGPFAPAADHHLHLFSPADVALTTPPLVAEVALPEDLGQLVRERERRWNDQAALAELYAEDGLFFRGGTVGWARGRAAAAGYARWTISDTPYHLKPTEVDRDGDSARVAGYLVEADGTDRHFGFFLLDLVKGADGVWRIAAETSLYKPPTFETEYTAEQLVAKLDDAGIRRGVVLSDAYYFDSVRPEPVPDEYDKVRAENDWTAAQVARYPDRLVAFFSVNPLRDYALAELERCAATGRFRGLKLHFNAAQLNFRDPAQVEKARRVMEAADRRGLPMIVHVRPGATYGREEAEAFLRRLVAAAPHVPIQIAHLWGGESYSAAALAVYADAVAAGDPATKNLYFDVSGVTHYGRPEDMPEVVRRIRQIGVGRILYGSDAPPREAWEEFRAKVPLTEAELRAIAANVAPYLRAGPPAR